MNSFPSSNKPKTAAPEFFSADVATARRFYLDLKPSKSRPLVVVCGGLERCKPDYAIRRDTFAFYSIEYVARGHGTVQLKGRSFSLQPGRLFAYGPGIAQHITGDPGDPLVKYFVDFAGGAALKLLRAGGLLPGGIADVFPANLLQPLFDELIQAGLKMGRKSPALCTKLLECLALQIGEAHAPSPGAGTLAYRTYQECRRHIEQNCLRLRTLKQIAAECHINHAYLCRLFQRYDNQGPYQYLQRLRINHAAERLQQPGALVKQVAEELGFADQFHFSRVFTAVLGLPPARFRELR